LGRLLKATLLCVWHRDTHTLQLRSQTDQNNPNSHQRKTFARQDAFVQRSDGTWVQARGEEVVDDSDDDSDAREA
jgi:hypothetical protein